MWLLFFLPNEKQTNGKSSLVVSIAIKAQTRKPWDLNLMGQVGTRTTACQTRMWIPDGARGKPTDTHSSFTTPVNSNSKVIVVWLLRGFPPSVFLFSGGETQQLQIPEGHVDLQRKKLSPNSLWNHPYISIVRGNWVMSSCQAYGRQSWRAITLSLYALAQTHFNTLFANKAKCDKWLSEHSE